jgi:hypothetical protein
MAMMTSAGRVIARYLSIASFVALLIVPYPAAAEPRLALVIGNSAYDSAFGPLANPVRDARGVAAALSAVGFQVVVLTDVDQREMQRAVSDFGHLLSRSGSGATALFFFAGHGLQYRGNNFLVPIGAQMRSEADIQLNAVAAESILRQMEGSGAITRIVILDACRDTPILRATRSSSRGLAPMEAPVGSFIAYSTAPGSTAADGASLNSPFAAALISELVTPNLSIEETFRNVRRAVIEATGGEQIPWDASSLVGRFVFSSTAGTTQTPVLLEGPQLSTPAEQSLAPVNPTTSHYAQRYGLEISVEGISQVQDRYVVTLLIRNLTEQDSAIAVQTAGLARAAFYLADGLGGTCQMAADGESWGSLVSYDPGRRRDGWSGTPVPAATATRQTLFFNRGRCDPPLTRRQDLALTGTFYVVAEGNLQPFPVAFEGLLMRGTARGARR